MKKVLRRLREEFPLVRCPAAVRESFDLADGEGDYASGGNPLAVGFSGGPDSVFLALWLLANLPRATERVELLHYNHGTRPEENEAEARFVVDWAKQWGFPLRMGRAEGPLRNRSEAAFRDARFSFFEKAMRESGSRLLLLGHQADDVAETMLDRLARGAGVEGLAAPRPVSFHHSPWPHTRLRPLLGISAGAIREFLSANGVDAVQDSSNAEDDFLRNRLRHQVVPRWKESVRRDVLAGVGRSRRAMEEMADFVESVARELAPCGWSASRISSGPLRNQHPAPVRFLLQRWLAARECRLSPEAVDEIVVALVAGRSGQWSAGTGSWIALDGSFLKLRVSKELPEWGPVCWMPGARIFLPDGAVLRREVRPADRGFWEEVSSGRVADGFQVYLQPPEGAGLPLTVRQWQAGDRFRPLGAPGRRKLQDWFTDRKIEKSRRHRLPVIACGTEILWVPGFPPTESARLSRPKDALLGLTYSHG